MNVYTVNLNNLKLLSIGDTSPFSEHLTDIQPDFLDRCKSEHASYDLYTSVDDNQTYSRMHYHEHFEIRIILRGTVTFYIIEDDLIYVITCSPGDKITIPPKLVHWFSYDGHLTVLRLFNTEEGRKCKIPMLTDEVRNAYVKLKKFEIEL